MVIAKFEHEGNNGILYLKTHFGGEYEIPCHKTNEEVFRLGGTAINNIQVYEGILLDFNGRFKAFFNKDHTFEGKGILSPEKWTEGNKHCYITEYYTLDMENNSHDWFISQSPLKDANQLFVNLDIIDGAGNLIRRCRVSPFTGKYKWLIF